MNTDFRRQLVVFTGSLITMTRKEAQSIAIGAKRKTNNHISKETTLLVVGHYSKSLFHEALLTKKEKLLQFYRSEGRFIRTRNGNMSSK